MQTYKMKEKEKARKIEREGGKECKVSRADNG